MGRRGIPRKHRTVRVEKGLTDQALGAREGW